MQRLEKNYKRIVVKIGSSLFYSPGKRLDLRALGGIIGQIIRLVREGREVVIVSSGAIALGMDILGLKERPRQLFNLQAAAAIGQNELMNKYRRFFKEKGYIASQVLLTREDFNDRTRYLNAKNTLFSLLRYKSIPVINENDTVSTEEIKFGDNDRLSALVCSLISADILIILSDVAGLLGRDKKTVIRIVGEITPEIKSLACPTAKKSCVGGMVTKIEAAKIAVDSGIPCVIADGRSRDIILSAVNEPGKQGTVFLPKKGLAARKRWIAFNTEPKGKVLVDEGAQNALRNNKSLLSVGIICCLGDFASGDIVSICDKEGKEFARGKTFASSKLLEKVKGSRYHKEIIHRNDIAVF